MNPTNPAQLTNESAVDLQAVPVMPFDAFRQAVARSLADGGRLASLFGQAVQGEAAHGRPDLVLGLKDSQRLLGAARGGGVRAGRRRVRSGAASRQ